MTINEEKLLEVAVKYFSSFDTNGDKKLSEQEFKYLEKDVVSKMTPEEHAKFNESCKSANSVFSKAGWGYTAISGLISPVISGAVPVPDIVINTLLQDKTVETLKRMFPDAALGSMTSEDKAKFANTVINAAQTAYPEDPVTKRLPVFIPGNFEKVCTLAK